MRKGKLESPVSVNVILTPYNLGEIHQGLSFLSYKINDLEKMNF